MVIARALVIVGSIVAIIGCFCPFMHLPFFGSVTYVLNGKGDGSWVVGICIVTLILASFRFATAGILGGALIGFLLLRVQIDMHNTSAFINATANGGSAFSGFAAMIAGTAYVEVGFYVVAAGSAVMLVGGVVSMLSRASAKPLAPRLISE